MPGNKKKIVIVKNKTTNLTTIYKTAIFNLKRLTSNLFVTKRKSIVAFKIRALLAFIAKRTITIQKSFSNLQINFIKNVPISVSYSVQES